MKKGCAGIPRQPFVDIYQHKKLLRLKAAWKEDVSGALAPLTAPHFQSPFSDLDTE